MNILSLPYHIDNFKMLLASFDNLPDIIGTIESNLRDKNVHATSVDLDI